MFKPVVDFVKATYATDSFIPLHIPQFIGNEKAYLNECIDSTYVSSVGKFVDQFEAQIAEYTGAKYAVAVSNGTAALHAAMAAVGVDSSCEVITQPLTFIATANAISYTGAQPVFIDVDKETMGLCPSALQSFLEKHCKIENSSCINTTTNKRIKACVPMHTFGFPCDIVKLKDICDQWHIHLIEDAAESLGSKVKGKHTGTFGILGTLSFNGNKVITAGGGGAILTNDESLAKHLKHITTTAKIPHKWEYKHDFVGFNYRMPNLNAALICAQLEQLDFFLERKRLLAMKYKAFYSDRSEKFRWEQESTTANFWLNTVELNSLEERNQFLQETNENGVMTRPVWNLMNELTMFESCQTGDLSNSIYLSERLVNIPSTPIL